MHNVSAVTLLNNSDIFYKRTHRKIEQTFIFHLPTVKEMYDSGHDFNIFRSLCVRTVKELSKDFNIQFEDRKTIFAFILTSPRENRIRQTLEYFLNLCWKKFRLVDDFIICNGFRVDNQVIEFFCNLISLGLGHITLEKFLDDNDTENLTPEELEWKRREEEYKSRIAAMKSNKDIQGIALEDMLLAISYDFKISLEDLINKNFYTILMYYSQVWKIDAYRTQLSYYGNSFAKPGKHKHWTQFKN